MFYPMGYRGDIKWITVVADATAASTVPYNPFSATNTDVLAVPMGFYTGVIVRAKYVTGQTLTTDPVVIVYGKRPDSSSWERLATVSGATTVTLSDATNDVTNATNNWTNSSEKVDALGCEEVLVTVATAAVSSSGAVTVEIARY